MIKNKKCETESEKTNNNQQNNPTQKNSKAALISSTLHLTHNFPAKTNKQQIERRNKKLRSRQNFYFHH